MPSLLVHADDLLRGRVPDNGDDRRAGLLHLLAMVATFGLLYGAVMGTFGGIRGERALQLLYSGLKVPLLLLVTFGLSLPSFFVLNALLGVRSDFAESLKALMATQ